MAIERVNKFAFLFPGQGSQYRGMGYSLYKSSEAAKSVFDWADRQAERVGLGFRITELCFLDPSDVLKGPYPDTSKIQPALFVTSLATLEHLRSRSRRTPLFVAGHSLGEITAAVATGALTPEAGFELVAERGRIMAEESTRLNAKVALIVGSDNDKPSALTTPTLRRSVQDKILELGDKASTVKVTVQNRIDQLLIAGVAPQVETAIEYIRDSLKPRIAEIYNGAPISHHPLMKDAQARIDSILDRLSSNFDKPKPMILDDRSGYPLETVVDLLEALKGHTLGEVVWKDVIDALTGWGVRYAIEVGPGRILQGHARGTQLKVDSTDTVEEVEKARTFLEAA